MIIAGAAAGGWYYQNSLVDSDRPGFRMETITRGDISALASATGTINPVEMVSVGAQVSGKIEKLYAKVNDRVTKGQLLAEIDPSLLLAQLKQDTASLQSARINFEQAERNLNRIRMLLQKDFVAKVDLELSQQAYQNAKNSYDAAKTVIERDNVNLNFSKITSPIDGVVIAQTVTAGQTLQTSQIVPELYKIAGNLTEMKIDVNFAESDITKIKVGMPVTFTVNAYPEREFAGKVTNVNLNPSSANSIAGVTYSVVVSVKNDEDLLLPGMTAYVSVILSEIKGVLKLPQSALRFNPPKEKTSALATMFGGVAAKPRATVSNQSGHKKTVYTLVQDALTPVELVTGASDEASIEIVSGELKEGDEVVVGIQKNKNR